MKWLRFGVMSWLRFRVMASLRFGVLRILVIPLLLLLAALAALLWSFAKPFTQPFFGLIAKGWELLSPYLARGLLALVLAWLLVVLAYEGVSRVRIAFSRTPYRPGTFTPERWKALLRESPERQVDLLSRADHQSLGLRPEEHLELLREVESLCQQEPALSVYWERRDQLEQALKQERQG
jgi:hypothetical protein